MAGRIIKPRSWHRGGGRTANLESLSGALRHWDSLYYGLDTHWNLYGQDNATQYFVMAWFRIPSGASTNDYNFVQLSDASASNGYIRLGGDSTVNSKINHYVYGSKVGWTSAATLYDSEWHFALGTARLEGAQWVMWTELDKDDGTDSYEGSPQASREFDRLSIGYEGDSSPSDEMLGGLAHVALGRRHVSASETLRLASGQNPLDVLGSKVEHYWPMTRETIRGHLNFDVVGGKTLRLTQADNPSSTANLFDFRGSKPCPVRPPALLLRKPLAFTVAVGAYTLTADGGTFTETGTAATLQHDKKLSAASGTFTETGTAASLEYGRKVQAESGTFTAIGTAADLEYGRKVQAESGTHVLTGTAATLQYGRKLSAAAGAFAWTGTAASLRQGRTLAAEVGAFAWTGVAATLQHDKKFVPAPAEYVVTGAAASLEYGREIGAEPGSYVYTGIAAGLFADRKLAADAGAFAHTGSDATLTYVSARTLDAESGAFVMTGSDMTPLLDRIFVPAAGAFAMAGSAAELQADRILAAASGPFVWTAGAEAALVHISTLNAEGASYALTGKNATLLWSGAAVSDFGPHGKRGRAGHVGEGMEAGIGGYG